MVVAQSFHIERVVEDLSFYFLRDLYKQFATEMECLGNINMKTKFVNQQ